MSSNEKRGPSRYEMDPNDVVVIGVDTADKEGEHVLWDKRAFLPLDEELVWSLYYHGPRKDVWLRNNNGVHEVIDGNRRTLHLREANKRRVKDGLEPWPLRFEKIRATPVELIGLKRLANSGGLEDDLYTRAKSAKMLLDHGLPRTEVAGYFTWSDSMLTVALNTLKLAPAVIKAADKGQISWTAASRLSPLSHEDQTAALEQLKAEANGKSISSTQTQGIVRERKTQGERTAAPKKGLVKRFLQKLDAEEIPPPEGVSSDFLAGVRWMLGQTRTERIKGLKKALDAAAPKKRTEKEATA